MQSANATTNLDRINRIKKRLKSKDDILIQNARHTGGTLHSEERLFPPNEESCELSVACRREEYSASRIAHAIEDAEAHLLNLNVTSETTELGEVIADIRISHRDAGAATRSLERYGYRVTGMRYGFDRHAEMLQRRIDELLSHINV